MKKRIVHNGGNCPIKSPDTRIGVEFRNGDFCNGGPDPVNDWCWNHYGSSHDIVGYWIIFDCEPSAETLSEKRNRLIQELSDLNARIDAHSDC